ncbi:MAG: hypothetical protein ACOYXO_09820 [Chloroflexota bacterium]
MGKVGNIVYRTAGVRDPFAEGDNPYLVALGDLPPKERKAIVRQVTLLCMATDLDPVEALELLAKLGAWMNDRPAQMLQDDYDLRKFREDKGNGRKATK